MPPKTKPAKLEAPTNVQTKSISSVEKIWGKEVVSHGYAGIPNILIRAQRRLGLSPTQMNIIVQLLEYWIDPDRKPFPSKKDLANRMGVNPKTIQINIRQLEENGLIFRESRKDKAGDYTSNKYHLDKLVARVQKLAPEFTQEREQRNQLRQSVQTPKGRRMPPIKGA